MGEIRGKTMEMQLFLLGDVERVQWVCLMLVLSIVSRRFVIEYVKLLNNNFNFK